MEDANYFVPLGAELGSVNGAGEGATLGSASGAGAGATLGSANGAGAGVGSAAAAGAAAGDAATAGAATTGEAGAGEFTGAAMPALYSFSLISFTSELCSVTTLPVRASFTFTAPVPTRVSTFSV